MVCDIGSMKVRRRSRRRSFEHPGWDVSACHNPRVADQWEYGTLTIALTGIHEQAGVVLTTSRGHLTYDTSAEEGLSPITKLRIMDALGKDGWVIAEGVWTNLADQHAMPSALRSGRVPRWLAEILIGLPRAGDSVYGYTTHFMRRKTE